MHDPNGELDSDVSPVFAAMADYADTVAGR
jgi:hypothetical protein